MSNFMKHLSEEYIFENTEVKDDSMQTTPKIIDYETMDCTDLGEISCIIGVEPEQEKNVRKFDVGFVVFYYDRL